MASARKPGDHGQHGEQKETEQRALSIAAILAEDSTALVHLPMGKYAGRQEPKGTMNSRRTITFVPIILVCHICCVRRLATRSDDAQDEAPQKKQQMPTIDEYQPKSTLVTKEHKIERRKFRSSIFIVHHWNPTQKKWTGSSKRWIRSNLRVMVNLSGGTGEELKKTVAVMKGPILTGLWCSRT